MSSHKFFDPTHKNPYLTFTICLILLFLLVACSLIGLVPKSEPRVAPSSPTPDPFQIVLPDLPEGSDNHEQDKEVQEEEDDDSGIVFSQKLMLSSPSMVVRTENVPSSFLTITLFVPLSRSLVSGHWDKCIIPVLKYSW